MQPNANNRKRGIIFRAPKKPFYSIGALKFFRIRFDCEFRLRYENDWHILRLNSDAR